MSTPQIVISAVTAMFAAAGLAWAISSFRLSGPRVKVRLMAGLLDGQGNVYTTGRISRGGSSLYSERVGNHGRREANVLLGVRVTNHGRAAATVQVVCLCGRGNRTRAEVIALHGKPLPCRIEPGENQSWFFEQGLVREFAKSASIPNGTAPTKAYVTVELGTGKQRKTPQSLVL